MTKRRELSGWAQIASYLNITIPTARKYRDKEELPVYKRGGRVYAFTDEIDEWKQPNDKEYGAPPAPTREPRNRKLRNWHVAVSTLALLTIVISILGTRQKWPDKAALEGETLRAYGEKGEILWEIQLSEHDDRYSTAPYSTLVQDIDHDGKNEVCLNYWPKQARTPGGRLNCYEHNSKFLWEYIYARDLTVKDRYFEPSYYAAFIELITTPTDSYILLILRHVSWYPTPVILLDPTLGSLMEEYLHPGALESIDYYDVNNDGKEEILLGGQNNPGLGFGVPVLAILEVPFRKARGKGNFFGDWNQREYSYLVFPRIDIFQVQEVGSSVRKIRILKRGLELLVGNPPGIHLHYTLDSNLQLLDIRPSDALVQTHNLLHREGRLDHPYSPEELEGWKRILMQSTAPDGNSPEIQRLLDPTPRALRPAPGVSAPRSSLSPAPPAAFETP